jgi:hypothetical protein
MDRMEQNAEQEDVREESEILPRRGSRASSTRVLDMIKGNEPARMDEAKNRPSPLQEHGSDRHHQMAVEHRMRRQTGAANGYGVHAAAAAPNHSATSGFSAASSHSVAPHHAAAPHHAVGSSLEAQIPDGPVSEAPVLNDAHRMFPAASNNPFVQPRHATHADSGYVSLNGSASSLPGAPPTQPHSRTRSISGSLLQQKKRQLPTIQSSSGQFNITHIGGNQTSVDSSYHLTSSNSGNNNTIITTGSNNDSSIRANVDNLPEYLPMQQYVLRGKYANHMANLPQNE